MKDVKAAIRTFVMDNFVIGDPITIADETSFMENHVLDSTGFMELVAFVEATFSVTVDSRELLPENFDSLANIEAYVARKRAAAAPS